MKINWFIIAYCWLVVMTYYYYSETKDINTDGINTPCTILNGYESYAGEKGHAKKFSLIVKTPSNKTIEIENVSAITYFKALKQKKMNFMLSPFQLEMFSIEIKNKLFLRNFLIFFFFVLSFVMIMYILDKKYDFL